MKATKNINIYLIDKKPVKVIDVVQYDTGIQLVFTVKDFGIPSEASATLYVQKPSGRFVYQTDGITIAGDIITIDLHNQALTEHGKVPYQVTITSGSDTVTSFAGLMLVERKLNDAGATESRTVIRAFDEVTVDKIAEFQASARTIADAVIATIPDDYTELTKKVNESANAIKGSLSGAVVRADDVSPVEHLMNVNVHGKNLVPFGTITFTKNKSYLLDNPIPAGTYTISAYITSSDTDGIYTAVSINNKNEVMKYVALKRNERVSATFTVEKPITNIDFCAAYNYSQGEGDSATWADIQLEEGNTATEYTPYVDPSTVTVTRCGKNLSKVNSLVSTGNVTGTISEVMFENKTYTASAYITKYADDKASNTRMTLLFYYVDGTSEAVHGDIDSTNAECDGVTRRKTVTGTPNPNKQLVRVDVNTLGYSSQSSRNAKAEKIQLEFGNTATEFEAYNGTEYIPTADGTIDGLTSVSPTMTLLTDTEGVTVECEYNKDTNKVISKLADALGITI